MPPINIDRSNGAAPIVIHPPTDPALRSIWDVAELEVEASLGKAIESKDEWNTVTARYNALIEKLGLRR